MNENTETEYEGLVFVTPARNRGGIVEVSYAAHADGVVERVYDANDRSMSYGLAAWTSELEEWFEDGGPQNSRPPAETRFF